MEPGTHVSFRREEPITCEDGSLYRWDTWTQEGVVVQTLPDGRIEIQWDDKHWDSAIGIFNPQDLTVVTP